MKGSVHKTLNYDCRKEWECEGSETVASRKREGRDLAPEPNLAKSRVCQITY